MNESTGGTPFSIDISSADPAGMVHAIKQIAEHFAARIAALEREVARMRLSSALMVELERNPQFCAMAKRVSYAELCTIIDRVLLTYLDAGGGEAGLKTFAAEQAPRIALAAVDGRRIDEPDGVDDPEDTNGTKA